MGRKVSQEEIDKFCEAMADGLPMHAAAKIANISRPTATRYLALYDDRIRTLQTVGEDVLLRRYKMRKEDEIVSVGTILQMIREELMADNGAKIKEMTAMELVRAYRELRQILPIPQREDDEDNPYRLFEGEEEIAIIARRRLRRVQYPPMDDEDVGKVGMEFDEE